MVTFHHAACLLQSFKAVNQTLCPVSWWLVLDFLFSSPGCSCGVMSQCECFVNFRYNIVAFPVLLIVPNLLGHNN